MPSKPTDTRFRWVARLGETLLAFVIVVLGWTCGFVFVEGGSMEPALSAGDVVVYRRHVPLPRPGDIVLFDHEGSLVVHRVARMEEDGSVRTQGDANRSADPTPVLEEELRGEVILVIPSGDLAYRLAALAH